MDKYKVAVIGGGPGGYVTAIRLNQLGIDCVVFEKERLGGVCLNWGCIPTKTLVKSADFFGEVKKSEEFGIALENPKINYKSVYERKNKVVDQLVSGIEYVFNKREIPVIKEVVKDIEKSENGYIISTEKNTINAEYVIVATGSIPKELPFMPFDGKKILSSRDILKMQELPETLAVVGGGVIGCEFASIYSQMGVKVTIIEFLPNLVTTEDAEISKRLTSALKKNKIKVITKAGVESFEEKDNQVELKLSNGKSVIADKVLVSVGRVPKCEINFNKCELELEKGAIKIDDKFKTNLPNIFAIGDVTGKMLLAHTASKQGLMTAEIIKSEIEGSVNETEELIYHNIPRCTFTHPEVGSVGLTEEEAKEKFGEVLTGKFPFTANGKALGLGSTFGFAKAIADPASKKIVGFHIIGPQATELISAGSILVNTGKTIEEAAELVYAHPTLSEAVAEAVEDLEGLAVHKI